MAFIIVVLLIHAVAEGIRDQRKNKTEKSNSGGHQNVRHPAEHELR